MTPCRCGIYLGSWGDAKHFYRFSDLSPRLADRQHHNLPAATGLREEQYKEE